MPIIYRTTPNDDKALIYLEKLGQDNWIYCGPLGDKLVFRKEQKQSRTPKDVSIDTEQAPIYGKEEINLMRGFLRQAVGVTAFKDSKERWYVQHCYNLMKKIGKEEFQARLQGILSDQFKAKNCNKLAYLYGELKSYIHSPVVEPTPKRFITSV